MPARRYVRDAITFLECLTLSAAGSTAAMIVACQVDAALSPPARWVWDGYPLGLFMVFTIVAWLLGSLPAACPVRLRLGIAHCSLLGFGYGLLVQLGLQVFLGADIPWVLGLAFAVSGGVGGATFAIVAAGLDPA